MREVQIYIKKMKKKEKIYTKSEGCHLSTGGGGYLASPRGM